MIAVRIARSLPPYSTPLPTVVPPGTSDPSVGTAPGLHVGGGLLAPTGEARDRLLARLRLHLVRCQMHLRASYCSPRPMFLHRLDRLIRAHEIVRDAERVGR